MSRKERQAEYHRKWYAANKDRIKAARLENIDVIRERERAYLEANREAILERRRNNHAQNKDEIAAKRKAYREKNKDRYYAQRREYRSKNKDKTSAYAKKYYERDREKILARKKETEVSKKYGIDGTIYDALISEAGGKCNICRKTEPGGPHNKFNVDHCHETGRIRGVLCQACNTGLGKLGDNYESIMRAARYLQDPPMSDAIARLVDEGLLV